MFSLQNKIALVTGAGSGIGAAIAETFVRANAFVYVTDRDESSGHETVARIKAHQGEAEFVGLDVTDEVLCQRVADRVHHAKQRLDVLVNNAGIGPVGSLLQTSGADMDRLYEVNVRGMFNVTKAFLPRMIERASGNIINLASIGGVVAVRDRLAYCTTKFAVVGFTKSIALDHATQGIRCNCICPARIHTPFVDGYLRQHYPGREGEMFRQLSAYQPVGRMGTPEEVAALALYLCSDEASFITGQAYPIDGGVLVF